MLLSQLRRSKKGGEMRIDTLQAARGVAALMIVVSHAHGAISKRAAEIGASAPFWQGVQPSVKIFSGVGVDMFLLLSGFFIFYVGWKKSARRQDYLAGRFLRVYPLWWIALTLSLVLTFLTGSAEHGWREIVLSYLLVPYYSPEGAIEPTFEIGWTLLYIVYYYVLYALFMNFEPLKRLWLITLTIAALVSTRLFYEPDLALLSLVTSPRTIGFAVGGWLAYFLLTHEHRYKPVYSVVALSVIAVFSYLFLTSEIWRAQAPIITRVPIALSLMIILIFDPVVRRWKIPMPLMLMGTASYSIYLFHQFPLAIVSGIYKRGLVPPGLVPPHLLWVVLVAAGVVAGLFAYFLFERPLASMKAGRFLQRRVPA